MAKAKIFAPLWKRVLAYIIDVFLISFIVVQPFTNAINSQVAQPQGFADIIRSIQLTFTWDMFILSATIAALTLTYWTFLEYKFGQTIGKIIFRIKVTGVKKNPTVAQIITRNVTKLSTVLIVLDTLYLLIKKGNQRYFEVISKTMVTDEPRRKL